ncbi:hypothetical protein G5714_009292 [Onychostoma macrolepis]|uniref:Uncharacterized protein n=1 Tax=Onychostoma macrolepis TaxID=369639 RepID=A0A7J6CS31_9TELE|nr:hypothetical protein G5714_009292 [Onychostoma macrolepis]
MMFCMQNDGYETIVNEIIALNTGAVPRQLSTASEASEIRPDNAPPHGEDRQILSEAGESQTENRGSLACLRRLVNRYPRDAANRVGEGQQLGRNLLVTAQVHAPVLRSTNRTLQGRARSFANTVPPPSQAFANGVGVRRQEASSSSPRVDRDVIASAVLVQARAQKTARPRNHSVIPNNPERKRPRQSTAWDDCDMNNVSNVDREEALNQQPQAVENAADSDGGADTLPSNQEEYKNQLQNDANKDILNLLNTVVKNQKRIIDDHQRAREEQARFNQTVTTTLQKHGIILKQTIALQKRHDGGHEQTAHNQEMIVTLLNELLDLFK